AGSTRGCGPAVPTCPPTRWRTGTCPTTSAPPPPNATTSARRSTRASPCRPPTETRSIPTVRAYKVGADMTHHLPRRRLALVAVTVLITLAAGGYAAVRSAGAAGTLISQ